jgi:hypothetical protein
MWIFLSQKRRMPGDRRRAILLMGKSWCIVQEGTMVAGPSAGPWEGGGVASEARDRNTTRWCSPAAPEGPVDAVTTISPFVSRLLALFWGRNAGRIETCAAFRNFSEFLFHRAVNLLLQGGKALRAAEPVATLKGYAALAPREEPEPGSKPRRRCRHQPRRQDHHCP